MKLVSAAPMATTTIVSAMAFIPAIKTGLASRTFSWRGKDHAPKEKTTAPTNTSSRIPRCIHPVSVI
ncbi:hypothetical protein DBIPINDM_003718 [Mesorhizobium sp. AR02]|uniref:hypothetical protein n=1 Tax=Mesorhizobium sp. AR02 TaxID=2865837 RepID=UPI002160A433|nr:hypothetical protein [Mesorhizobium sp. AR02]UVK50544.1 hypothetical protein DBIPINDM_003718 [Mesorhizobium sp. AR02]